MSAAHVEKRPALRLVSCTHPAQLPAPVAAVDADVVHCLRTLLKLAEAGYVTGLIYAFRRGPGEHSTAYCGAYRQSIDEAVCAAALLTRNLLDDVPPVEW